MGKNPDGRSATARMSGAPARQRLSEKEAAMEWVGTILAYSLFFGGIALVAFILLRWIEAARDLHPRH
jgi:hypothetical protein